MAFPFNGVIDDFNRSENPLSQGGAWIAPLLPADDEPEANGSACLCPTTFADAYRTITVGPDCESYMTITTPPNNGEQLYLWVRILNPSTAIQDEYALVITRDAGTDIWQVYRGDDLIGTQLGGDITQELSAGNKIGFEIIGTTLSVYYHNGSAWSLLGTRSDGRYTSMGHIGFGLNQGTVRVDDFGGGTIETAALTNVPYSQFPKPKLRLAA